MRMAVETSIERAYLRSMSEMMKTRMRENAVMIVIIIGICVISVLFS